MSGDFTRSLVCDVAGDEQEHGLCAWHSGRGVGCSCSCHDDPRPWMYQDGERWAEPSPTDDEHPKFAPRLEHERSSAVQPDTSTFPLSNGDN